ncbi:class I SAM-dependent methyltransferase [Variovorax terrae]|uniref:Class I SAM-dependent methyltransferase n=1 Tax=Variovorax terrae TaxID=2923278 RepID=A0A9X1VQC0_9BURK|nr:class I SAM-dependent methyltransferase [Variovorax terrae]MCJ0761866.1 class I SAM-dependent methyltransferase [Variovorax terrae]
MATTRNCPVCDTPPGKAEVFLEENIDQSRITGLSFASRKEPEYMCHRFMRCPTCDLVYVDAPPSQDALAQAYHQADYDSAEEGNDAAAAYIHAIRSVLARLPERKRALEIGTGTAVFLERLKNEGFAELVGVEPSVQAIASAPEHRKPWIREGIFVESDFEPASFDLICCFMTMEHVLDPKSVSDAALRLLKPGGAFVTVTHDYTSWVNRVLGKKSPIIDIEHMQLFSTKSISYLFRTSGLVDVQAERFANRYSLRYWARLLPLPQALKSRIGAFLSGNALGRQKLSFNVGNTIAAGYRKV